MRLVSMLKLLGLAGLSLALGAAAPSAMPENKKLAVGQPAPDATFTFLDNSKVKLSDLRGKVVVINFWATWCGPCREELPLLDHYQEVREKNGLRVIAMTTQGPRAYSRMKELVKLLSLYPAKAMKGPYAPIKGAIPTNYIIGRDGTIRYAKAAAMDLDTLNRELVPLLNERWTPPAAEGAPAK